MAFFTILGTGLEINARLITTVVLENKIARCNALVGVTTELGMLCIRDTTR